MISVIIPCLNEADNITATLEPLQALRRQGHEIILVDGGSLDGTPDLARPLVDTLVFSPPGRARQMNAGMARALGDILWFLHADTLAEAGMAALIEDSHRPWGRFDVRLSGNGLPLRIIETLMNWRSRLTGIATGDQGIFVNARILSQLGGYADIPLMEDIELSQRLKKHQGRPLCLRQRLVTSSRRWESDGLLSTVLLMWRLRLAYFFGADPQALARQYR